jgi:7,8-dihydropterin-6-yl-methyl-4-(beta-D-ribofuranosyl)aminobenzene 5'-phosphate synthase
MTRITIVYDNLPPLKDGLQADWGFSSLVEIDGGKTILFDTGGNGEILLHNMAVLGIEPSAIGMVFISHAHHDHTGGLKRFLEMNNSPRIWLPAPMKLKHMGETIISGRKPFRIMEGIFSTGVLEGIEQSLVLSTSKGLLLIVGCSHPDMGHILSRASQFGQVYGIIGGLHSTQPESLEGLQLICATHCTQHRDKIQSLYPDAFIQGGAGQVITLQ